SSTRASLICQMSSFFFFQAEDGIRDFHVTGVQTCALPIYTPRLIVPLPTRDQTRAAERSASECYHGGDPSRCESCSGRGPCGCCRTPLGRPPVGSHSQW